jgi:hypothetical protein
VVGGQVLHHISKVKYGDVIMRAFRYTHTGFKGTRIVKVKLIQAIQHHRLRGDPRQN